MGDEITKIAVIGAGLSGLVALCHLSQSNKKLRLTAFEKNYDVGGQWLYTDQTTTNEFGLPVHSGIYRNLRTNLPLPIMTIPGFPHDKDMPTFPERSQILSYLQSYCDKNDLRKYIKFNTVVQKVRQVSPKERFTKWNVTYYDVRKKRSTVTEEFDYIIVGSGIFHTPSFPTVKGSNEFKGHITHSVHYRHPEIYQNQNVAIIGGKFSAIEICQQVSQFAKEVYICHRSDKLPSSLPANVIPINAKLEFVTSDTVILQNGEKIAVDSIIYCTGYKLNNPFLPDNFLQFNGCRITNLYKEMIPVDNATIMFIMTVRDIAQFIISGTQAKYMRLLIEGSVELPDIEEMKKVINYDVSHRNLSRHTQLEYDMEIAALGNFEGYLKPRHERMLHLLFENYFQKQPIFRTLDYE